MANPPPGSLVFSGEGSTAAAGGAMEKVVLGVTVVVGGAGGGVASLEATLGLKLTVNGFGVGVPAGVVTGATTLGGGVVNAIVGTTLGGAALESRSLPPS